MKNTYSVGQVNRYIKNMFTQDYLLQKIYVKGEVSNCKYHTSGHIYFSLKDETGTLNCVMFAGHRRGLAFAMKNGDKVIVGGSVDVYERDGRYYLYFCGDGQTNVAVSDHIDGGYALQGDLARTGSHAARHGFGTGIVAPGIDPAAFRDPQTGRWYLAWGRTGRATPACPTTCCASSPKPRPTSGRPHI